MKLKEFSLSVFSIVIIGLLFLGSQNIHSLAYHSSSDNETSIHCEQCEFIYSENHTSFLDFCDTQVNTPALLNIAKADFTANYKAPETKSLCEFIFFNRPPPVLVFTQRI